jgi:hypothetical protein
MLCHTTPIGQVNTAMQPFALALKDAKYGLTGGSNTAGLLTALMAAEATLDADKDGALDIAELSEGRDPNTSGGDGRICGPDYGCGAHVARTPPRDATPSALAGAVAALVAFGLRRRR